MQITGLARFTGGYSGTMCGRYHRTATLTQLQDFFKADAPLESLAFAPGYNIAPSTEHVIARQARDSNRRELVIARWGLIGHRQGPDPKRSTINARKESLLRSDLWRDPLHRRRCIVPADGFFEWNKTTREVWRFTVKGSGLFGFAGLWDAWKNPQTDEWIQSFAIITVPPNELMVTLHDRMPAILHPQDYDEWLDRKQIEQPPIHLLKPYEANEMELYRANPKVGNVRNQGPDLLNSL